MDRQFRHFCLDNLHFVGRVRGIARHGRSHRHQAAMFVFQHNAAPAIEEFDPEKTHFTSNKQSNLVLQWLMLTTWLRKTFRI